MSLLDTDTKSSLSYVYLRISPDKFHFLKFILEGYDNLAILSSFDMRKGIVVVRFPSHQQAEFYSLLVSIAHKIAH